MINSHRTRVVWSSVLMILLSAWPVAALNSTKSVHQYNCRSWARQNGLPANSVLGITQTEDGYLWLGTPRGLVRFDGTEYKLFDFSHLAGVRSTIVTSISRSRGGGLWFGLERGGFGFCDGRNISLLGRDEWGGKGLFVQSLFETRQGDLWIGAERLGGKLTLKSKTFQELLTTTGLADERYDVTCVYEDSKGRVWMGTAQQGLFYYADGKITRFGDPALDGLTIHCLVEDKLGQIWIGTQLGLLCYGPDFKRQPLPFPWWETRALLVDREGAVWAGTSGGGLVRHLNGTTSQLQKTDGLADDYIIALEQDTEGSLWIGTRNGLSQLSDVKIPTLGKAEGLTADINVGVFESRKGGFWIATDKGFTFYNGEAKTYSTNVGLKDLYIKQILEATNRDLYLINGLKDIEIFSGERVVARYANKVWPTAMAEDAHGVVVALARELYRVGTNYLKPYEFADGQKPPLRWIFWMTSARDGSIWVAAHGGLCQIRDGSYKLWQRGKELPESKCLWVCEDKDGVIWAGLETGIARIKNGKVRVITQQDGLFDNIVNAIVPDDHGLLWVDSSRGFFSVSRSELNDFADGKVRHVRCEGYDGLDAIKSSEKFQQQPSGCKTADGRIWFPTAQGVAMIDPTNLNANPVPPKVFIQQVIANGHELKGSDQAVMRPGDGNLQFTYVGLSYIAPLKIRYRYKLEGYDKEWVDAGGRRAAFYTNLKPGNYRFYVEACNEDAVWNTTGASFPIKLLPHFYQTLWFYALCGGSFASVLIMIYRWRVRHLRLKQISLQQARDLLEAKVAERTASLVSEVQERVKTQQELENRKTALEKEIEERKRMQIEVERVHRQLIDASRQAGQAEVASNVLHNVGNVLNSVNVSTSVLSDRLRQLQVSNLARAAQLLQDHGHDLPNFLTTDERGRKLPDYLQKLAQHLGQEQDELVQELKELATNVEHIKEIVAMQQSYAKMSGILESVPAADLVESALKMHATAYARHSVHVTRHFDPMPPIVVDRHKVLQILINILHNAKYACQDRPDKHVEVTLQRQDPDRVRISVSDNGIGIAPENLTRIFSHGFTTRKNGHGFGLHSAALAANEMGGSLQVQSEGIGKGATFILELPIRPSDESGAEIPGTSAGQAGDISVPG
ncbi:MAG TPA: two-component regulator propeller domain-containing protein [Verrucomicrobiae bacterium]|nr:two-component regulator propeller domain-containing protein [Verrucomicrobiae bacterium]